MEMWVLEMYDEWFSCPVTVGVYTTFDRARAAYDIIRAKLMEEGRFNPDDRFCMVIVPITIDSFIDVALEWIYN